ncbi:hypothetical protein JJE66_29375 [Bradyrhizobium diazoefficiens]|uniref:hypothetical protein n=1 Tax=Bradyrhizobium diazoefficiens TaxID=1355477 RepID=UPI00190A72B5|nr:hypothetical protein [Bradyrhizobium diazoefficiens]MBK3665330.1 hypothetical protein [Bradyrhizobium diazoefficiens]
MSNSHDYSPLSATTDTSSTAQATSLCNAGRDRQWAKIREITEALRTAGFESLDQQAGALGLSRSTTWSILSGQHKNSGLSTSTITRILSNEQVPKLVRKKLLEYVEEKAQGLYGDNPIRVEQFKERLARLQP